MPAGERGGTGLSCPAGFTDDRIVFSAGTPISNITTGSASDCIIERSVGAEDRRGSMSNNLRPQDAARPKAWLAWSSGKDSAWVLRTVRQDRELDVVALLTTVNHTHGRVAMHAVRESLLEVQAAAAELPLVKVPIPSPCPNEVYEQAMNETMTRARADGVRHVIFGDLFLEDVRAYRET